MARTHKKKRLEAKYGKKKPKTTTISLPAKEKFIPEKTNDDSQNFFEKNYKILLLIPFLLLVAGFVAIGVHYTQTGDFLNRGISLKGGTAITLIPSMADLTLVDTNQLADTLRSFRPGIDVNIRTQRNLQDITAIEIEVDITDQEELDAIQVTLSEAVEGLSVEEAGLNVQTSGSSLGDAFFRQILQALIVAFILMGIVIFIQFKVAIPSLAVILAAFSDIIVTLAIVNILDIKLGTAGIAAFLMLIGYSVDTDVLLSTRVLKNTEGTLLSRIRSAVTTGMTMNITTLAAILVALIFTQSDVIRQIMTILFIGLIVDMINTWIQNVGIIRWYAEKKGMK